MINLTLSAKELCDMVVKYEWELSHKQNEIECLRTELSKYKMTNEDLENMCNEYLHSSSEPKKENIA